MTNSDLLEDGRLLVESERGEDALDLLGGQLRGEAHLLTRQDGAIVEQHQDHRLVGCALDLNGA